MITRCSATKPFSDAEWAAVWDLRHAVLRAPWNQPRGTERDPQDDSPSAIHAAVFEGPRCVGCALAECDTGVWKVHFVAVDTSIQGKGIGKTVMTTLEQAIRDTHTTNRVELFGRFNAVPFYERLGYVVTGPGPTKFETVHHKLMAKQL